MSPRHARRKGRTAAASAALIVLAAGSLLLAACGRGVGTGPAAGTPGPREKPAAATHHKTTRHDLALRDARQLLADVVLPPHTTSATDLGGQLGAPPQTTSGNLVDLHRFFTIPGAPPSALRGFRQHPPRGSSNIGSGSTGSIATGITLRYLVFGWPQVPTLFNVREVLVSAARLSSGRTGIRIDAQVTWLPAKPARDLVPPGATRLIVSLSRGPNPGQGGHKPVTISSPEVIAAIRHRVNRLGVFPPGATNCPADFGQELTMVFRRSAGSPLAVVRADPAGCELVSVTENGRSAEPVLSGGGLVPFVEREIGWQS